MKTSLDEVSVEELSYALRLCRGLLFSLIALLVGGFAAVVGLSYLGTWLSPPYGVYIYGESLSTWGLIVLVVLIFGTIWLGGRRIGQVLNDPVLMSSPFTGILSAGTVIAQRAQALDMEVSGMLGPLRPARRRQAGSVKAGGR